MAKSVDAPRTSITPSEIAGVAIRVSPIELVAMCLNGLAGFDHQHLAVFIRQIDLAVGRHRRGAEAAAHQRQALAIDLLAGCEIVGIEHAVVGEHVEQAAIGERRRHVRAAAGLAPRDVCVGRVAFAEREIAASAGFHGKHRAFRRAAAGDDVQAAGEDRRRRGDLRAAAKLPQLAPGLRIVAADEIRRVGDELRARGRVDDRRRAPRRQLLAIRLPHRFAGLGIRARAGTNQPAYRTARSPGRSR